MDTKIFIKKNFLCSLFQVIFPKNIYTIIFDYIEILNQVASFSLSEIKNYHHKGSHKLYDCDFYYSCNCICKCTCNCNCFNSRNICYNEKQKLYYDGKLVKIFYNNDVLYIKKLNDKLLTITKNFINVFNYEI